MDSRMNILQHGILSSQLNNMKKNASKFVKIKKCSRKEKYIDILSSYFRIQNGLSSCICLDDIMKLPQNIEEALRTELYFSLNDSEILGNVSSNILWDYLLSNNKINTLKIWIDTKYNSDDSQISDKIDPHLKSLFTNLNITPDMIDYIDSSNAGDLVKNLAKNHLCRYAYNSYIIVFNIIHQYFLCWFNKFKKKCPIF